jgi:hypothetical protein
MSDATDVTATSPDQPSLAIDDAVETELRSLAKHGAFKGQSPLESNAERIRSSLARLSSSSIQDLEALTAELKRLQDFLKSEVSSVERQIEGALSGINIIIDTIAPWKNTVPPSMVRPKNGPAASIEVTPPRRMAGS